MEVQSGKAPCSPHKENRDRKGGDRDEARQRRRPMQPKHPEHTLRNNLEWYQSAMLGLRQSTETETSRTYREYNEKYITHSEGPPERRGGNTLVNIYPRSGTGVSSRWEVDREKEREHQECIP